MSIADKLTTIAENQEKVFNAGKDKEWNTFWDALQSNGTRRIYTNGFYGEGWTDDNFKPKHDINVVGSGGWMFQNTKITKIKDVKFDISKCTNVQAMFYGSSFEELPALDVRSCSDLRTMFNKATKLRKIEELILDDNKGISFTNTFQECTSLTDISILGEIYKSIDFSSCPLTPKSMANIIKHLHAYGYEGPEAYVYTITFSEECWAALEESDIDLFPYDFLPTWKDVVMYKGWNT